MRQSKVIFKKASLRLTVLLSGMVLLMISCTKEKRSSTNSNSVIGPPGASNLASLQSDIFTLGCAASGCHDNSATPAGDLNMTTAAKSFENMVNKNSSQASAFNIVVPNDPSTSYLIHKLQGTHLSVGGSGVQMPQYAAALSQSDFDRIVTWINNGAPND